MHETNGIPTVDLKIQFKNAARLGEILTKKLWVIELKNSSILCGFEFVNESENTVLAGEVTLVNVAFSPERNGIKAEPFSDEMKRLISNYE
jgi:4-hydroxybenzoyl-CoA thioesterase